MSDPSVKMCHRWSTSCLVHMKKISFRTALKHLRMYTLTLHVLRSSWVWFAESPFSCHTQRRVAEAGGRVPLCVHSDTAGFTRLKNRHHPTPRPHFHQHPRPFPRQPPRQPLCPSLCVYTLAPTGLTTTSMWQRTGIALVSTSQLEWPVSKWEVMDPKSDVTTVGMPPCVNLPLPQDQVKDQPQSGNSYYSVTVGRLGGESKRLRTYARYVGTLNKKTRCSNRYSRL